MQERFPDPDRIGSKNSIRPSLNFASEYGFSLGYGVFAGHWYFPRKLSRCAKAIRETWLIVLTANTTMPIAATVLQNVDMRRHACIEANLIDLS